MRTVKLRAFPLYFVSCGALLAACSSNGSDLPANNGTSGTGATSGSNAQAGTPSVGGSSAGTATMGGAGTAGALSGGSGGSGGGITTAGTGGSGGSAGGQMVGFQRPKGQLPNI